MWCFAIKEGKFEDFEKLCKKYGYEIENYYDDGWCDVFTGSEDEPTELHNECIKKGLLDMSKYM